MAKCTIGASTRLEEKLKCVLDWWKLLPTICTLLPTALPAVKPSFVVLRELRLLRGAKAHTENWD